jgi:hypothetical protein
MIDAFWALPALPAIAGIVSAAAGIGGTIASLANKPKTPQAPSAPPPPAPMQQPSGSPQTATQSAATPSFLAAAATPQPGQTASKTLLGQ